MYGTYLMQRRTRECYPRKFTMEYSQGNLLAVRDWAKFFASQGNSLALARNASGGSASEGNSQISRKNLVIGMNNMSMLAFRS